MKPNHLQPQVQNYQTQTKSTSLDNKTISSLSRCCFLLACVCLGCGFAWRCFYGGDCGSWVLGLWSWKSFCRLVGLGHGGYRGEWGWWLIGGGGWLMVVWVWCSRGYGGFRSVLWCRLFLGCGGGLVMVAWWWVCLSLLSPALLTLIVSHPLFCFDFWISALLGFDILLLLLGGSCVVLYA